MYICKGVFPEKFDQRSNFFPNRTMKNCLVEYLGKIRKSASIKFRIVSYSASRFLGSSSELHPKLLYLRYIPRPRKTEDITGVDFRLYIFVLVVVELCIAYPEREESKRFEKGRRGEKRDREKKKGRGNGDVERGFPSRFLSSKEREERREKKEREREKYIPRRRVQIITSLSTGIVRPRFTWSSCSSRPSRVSTPVSRAVARRSWWERGSSWATWNGR